MIFRLSLFLLGTFLWSSTQAQDKQYIVKFNGDTISGQVKISVMRDNSKKMLFKGDDGSRGDIYPLRVTYVYFDEKYQFRSVPYHNNQRLFMQILKEAENVNYYNYIHKSGNSVAVTKYATKPSGETVELSSLSFNKQMREFLADCPAIVDKLEKREDYRFKHYEKLFDDYDNCDRLVVQSQSMVKANDAEPTDVSPAPAVEKPVGAAVVASGVAASEITNTPSDQEKQKKLEKIDEFRKYLRGVNDFEHTKDVLEWLTDIEYRVSQNGEIPNYLWSSLDAMTSGSSKLQEKAKQLQSGLTN